MFTSSGPNDVDSSLRYITAKVPMHINRLLVRDPSEGEIRTALFDINPDKAPGPDGMTSRFYQNFWPSIGHDVVRMVKGFFVSGSFDPRLNQTNICLIPKSERPKEMSEYRPISLCNVSYKIISKILCKRLKTALPTLISETQSAFLAGRLITDNILLAQENFHALRTNVMCKAKFMAIKTDMSKAYDRVEWEFLEKLMIRMGFENKWIKWIMWCISSVSYQVLINGEAKGNITPSRGLRQGDPLSPLLFIMCTEALISLLKGAEAEQRISGMRISRASPSVSHLLFADDSLFFCKADLLQSAEIFELIRCYGNASGQQINLRKSSIVFGNRVPDETKANIKELLGISTEGGMGLYLGIPEHIGGSKISVFAFIQDRLNKRINNWTAKFLSKGGKETLIKSVAQAIPTYVMSCFLLPKGIIKKLQSRTSNFWWSSKQEGRGLHWVAWDKLCAPKKLGGLGFRDLRDFNLALLAKQLWRLLRYPSSLLARVLRGRYYRQGSPLEIRESFSPSFGWRSILAARPLLRSGIRRIIGSGCNTKVWEDPWIPEIPARPTKGIDQSQGRDPNLLVHHLIKAESKEWDEPLLRSLFQPSDVTQILGMRPSRTFRLDGYAWSFTKSGTFTVKSGYEVARSYKPSPRNREFSEPSTTVLKDQIWKTNTSQKLKHFMWQAISGCVATNHQLSSRHIGMDEPCPRCGNKEESINHLLFECPPAVQVWALSRIPSSPGLFPSSALFSNFDFLLRSTKELGLPEIQRDTFPWLLWYIWKARNDKSFKGKEVSPMDTLQLATIEADSWKQANKKDIEEQAEQEDHGLHRETQPTLPWTLPKPTCQTDASWIVDGQVSGLGWCLKVTEGRPLIGQRGMRQCLSPLHAELEGALWAMTCLLERNITSVRLETDCADLLRMTENAPEWPAFSNEIEIFQQLREEFRDFGMVLIPRLKNVCADSLAKQARAREDTWSFVGFKNLERCPTEDFGILFS